MIDDLFASGAPIPVFLAPMAGITDLPFRGAVLRYGAAAVFSEMVASGEMIHAKPSVRARAELGLDQAQTAIQLAGRDAQSLAAAARICVAEGARAIDLNFGCPAKKVTNGWSGSALMRDLNAAEAMIAAVVDAVSVPVSVKMRLGWDETSRNAPELAARAEACGVAMVTVHARTRCQFYKGSADWAAVADIRAATGLPLVVNGDIHDAETARAALRLSGADGVMLGRAVQGRPWLLRLIYDALNGSGAFEPPKPSRIIEEFIEQYRNMLDFYGAELGLRVARKHLDWTLRAVAQAPDLRRKLLTERSAPEVLRQLERLANGLSRSDDVLAA